MENERGNTVSHHSRNPRIDIEVLFDRYTHSYSQREPPTVTLKATLTAPHPVTIFTWRCPLDVEGALVSDGFTITNVESGERVKTTFVHIQRPGFSRARSGPDERYFLTLHPNTPLEISTGFGYGPAGGKPEPYEAIKDGWMRDENGNRLKIRRSSDATGVDGLKPGHQYTIGLDTDKLQGIRWAPVVRDEILVEDPTKEGSGLSDYPWRTSPPIEFHVKDATLSIQD